jgi:hypothetical protein
VAYDVKLVDYHGAVIRVLTDANVVSISEVLNGFGQAIFTYPATDPASAVGQGAAITMLYPEVQIWRDGNLDFWGVPVQRSGASNRGDVQVTCNDLGWYLTKRAVDKVPTNFLANPDFESGMTGWATNGSVTAVAETDRILRGTQAARLTGTGGDDFISQVIPFTAGTIIGLGLVLVGWFYVESFSGPATGDRGLYIEGRDGSGFFLFSDQVNIDSSTPVGEWQRVSIAFAIPPGSTWNVNVRLYAPHGSIVWDTDGLFELESLGAWNADMATLCGDVVTFIQAPSGKGDLNIGTDTPATGQIIPTKFWQFADHTMADRALDEYVQRDPGLDWSIEITSTTRTFTTHYPRQGNDLTATVTLQLGVNVATCIFDEDATATETDVTILGPGSGPDREIGNARDTSAVSGLVLQGIYPATPDALIGELDPQASHQLARSKRPVKLPQPLVIAPALLGALHKGDVVDCNLIDGTLQAVGHYRIARIDRACRSGTQLLTLNEDL